MLGTVVLRYLSADGYAGADQVTYTVRTADGTSAPVTQHFNVSPDVNVVPSCSVPATLRVRAGGTRTFTLSCIDADGDPLSPTISSAPQHVSADFGASVVTGREVTISAPAGYTGPDSVSLRASDGRGLSAPATVAIDVVAADANTAPTCFLDGGGSKPVRDRVNWVRTIACQDPEGDDIGVEVVTQPAHGTAAGGPAAPGGWLGRAVAYTPSTGYTGPDTFTVRGRDARGATSATFTVNITVIDPEPPETTGPVTCWATSTLTVRAGGSKRVYSACSGDAPVGLEILTGPAHGTVTKDNGFVYKPAAGYTGADSFSYRILSASGAGPEVIQPISVVAGANEPPSCGVSFSGRGGLPPSEPAVRAGTEAGVALYCVDPDGDTVTATAADPAHGTLSPLIPDAGASWYEALRATAVYRPDDGFTGFDGLDVVGDDGHGGKGVARADVTVRPASFNTAPGCATLGGFPQVIIAGTEAEYAEACWDSEGDKVRIDVVRPPANVTLSPVDGQGRVSTNAVIRAPAGMSGTDNFDMVPEDARGARGGVYGRGFQIIPDPGPVDQNVRRGGTVGAGAFELPSPSRPAILRLTTLNEGRVRIVPVNATVPDGWTAVGLTFEVTAPDAIPEAPLNLRFRFDGSLRGAGEPLEAFTVFRNGRPVQDCTGDGATPDPCVESRRELVAGDFEIVVRSSKASTWSLGRGSGPVSPLPPSPGPQPSFSGGETGRSGSEPVPGSGAQSETLQPPVLSPRVATRLRAALTKGFQVKLTSPYAGTARAKLTLDGKTAKRLRLSKGKPVAVATGTASAQAGRPTTITLRFTKAAKRALGKAKKATFTLQAGVNDGPVATKKVTLKR